ncbi:BTAD domain-containing putative transcriptional regulator [Paenibacillus sp. D2_2]|uniref:AfsR/SARP family transcriptional regulator n=1 Tax=Paenibacillus sp. D2_2 TaxID=3073092 RepID=UPI0028150199|nr:BTAD domain-containing putative transcriptional regulator [Paenibacillus sp. D2_2]WMT40991.1 BTAD domain-containing putative transcriptional regulator [Paenibacillus sp. D2_2]
MLYTTMYQLRKELEAFGLFEVIEQSRAGGGRYRLLWAPDNWDYDEFEIMYQQFIESNDRTTAASAIELYRGGYLTDNGYEWATEKRIVLELKVVELLEYMADYEVKQRRFGSALSLLQRWENLQPYTIRVHDKIIALHLLMSNADAADAHEKKVEDLFASELGISPDIDRKILELHPLSVF